MPGALMIASSCTTRIGRIAGSAHACLEDDEIAQVYVIVTVQNGILAIGVGLGLAGAGVARLEMAEVLLVHVAVAVEVTRNRQ
jgi:hypothetical protein